MMIWIYREGGDGKIDTQLAVSRDGIAWTRVGERATWLALGDDDGWEGGMIRSVEKIIPRGEQLFIYYCGVHGAHVGPKFKNVMRKHPVMIGLLTQRRDGFVSLDAGDSEGSVTTRTFQLPSGSLYLNADATNGEVHVKLLDADDQLIAKSSRIHGDQLRARVILDQEPPAPGTTFKINIAARNAKIYSYWFAN